MPAVKIATYNIRYGKGIDGKVSLSRIAGVLQQINPDIIALQEMDKNRLRSYGAAQAKKLAKALKMNYVYGAVKRYCLGSYGNAVLTRYPIISYQNHLLPDSKDPRCCLQVNLNVEGVTLSFFNIHLGLNHTVRMYNVEHFVIPLIKSINHPVILAGDFNVTADGEEIKMLSPYLNDTFTHSQSFFKATFPSNRPVERIDYIFINNYCSCNEFDIINSQASDHLPIKTQIGFTSC
ncbi:MAG TPA: endonuclease/exonuclease/phosphatase family protein [Syntrophomonadaceae bacterium]|nr:endonuclease/exonuclease/phosphatase family protein [Syntrophomonadaceae bacterium]